MLYLRRAALVAALFVVSVPMLRAQTLVLAVGLERLVPTYSGPAIRIQRASDNAQMDIGFAAGSNALDSTAVSNFLGTTMGFITTLYAQDGSGNNVLAPTSSGTSNMPTIGISQPTGIVINGTNFLTARNVIQAFGSNGYGNNRYFVLPSAVTVNKSSASAFLACRLDDLNAYSGGPMSLYEVGNPMADAFDLYSSTGGFQGLTHNSSVTFGNNSDNVVCSIQPTVLGLVSSPTVAPTVYVNGVAHVIGTTGTASATVSGGYLMAGTGTGLYYGISLFATYNFLGFELYNGTVSAAQASTISTAMIPHVMHRYNLVGDGDSITQGTGDTFGQNMLHDVDPLLGTPSDITDLAVFGVPSTNTAGHPTYPTPATSLLGMLYNPSYARNIYYLSVGTNDIHGLNSTGQSVFNIVIQTLANAKALGYTAIGTTLLHENGETASAGMQIDAFNALMRNAKATNPGSIDAVVDYAADPRLGIVTNYYPTYSVDGTHPNDAGYAVMAQDAAPIFNQFIGPGPTDTPTLPQWGLLALAVLLFGGAVLQVPRLSNRA